MGFPISKYTVKVTTESSVSHFTLSSMLSVQDFIESNLVTGTKFEVSKL